MLYLFELQDFVGYTWNITTDKLEPVDMVILSVGIEPGENAAELSKMLGISTDDDGWFSSPNHLLDPVATGSEGITIAGVCEGPKDIPDTVVQASAAASRVLQRILTGVSSQ